MKFKVLYENTSCVIIDKPAGVYSHPPEDTQFSIPYAFNALAVTRDQVGCFLYPVHRLDRATSGVLVFAKTPGDAKKIQEDWHSKIHKTYVCLVRGWPTGEAKIERPLDQKQALTFWKPGITLESPFSNKKFASPRVSFIWAYPKTGRFHQIRRHMAGKGYPIIGDTQHGDSAINQWFLQNYRTGKPHSLFLKCYRISYQGHWSVRAFWKKEWLQAFDKLGVCPVELPQDEVDVDRP